VAFGGSSIAFRYDERFRIVEAMPSGQTSICRSRRVHRVLGYGHADYKIGMLKKQKLYQQEGNA